MNVPTDNVDEGLQVNQRRSNANSAKVINAQTRKLALYRDTV